MPPSATSDPLLDERLEEAAATEPEAGDRRPPPSRRSRRANLDRRRFAAATVTGLGAACIPYLWVLWDGSLNPLRTDFPGNAFSNFYDLQARALLHGHWWLANNAIGIESFDVHGRSYTYFGPFPALLRIPVLLFTSRLDGRLTALSMLAAWLVAGVLLCLLLWRVRILVRGAAPLMLTEAVAYGFTVAAMMGGSVLVYLASSPYVYNEDFSWGVATSLGSLFALLGMLESPSRRRLVVLGLFLLAADLSRLTDAWGCVIGVLLASAWFFSGRAGEEQRRWALPTLLVALAPLALGCYVTWAKFGYPFGLPMADQVWTQVDQHRQQFLAANGGKAFSIGFIPTTALTYLRPDGIRFTDVWPFVTLPALAPRVIGGAVMDMTYRTASAPASMPLAFVLGVWGAVATFRRRPAGRTALVRIPMLAAAAATVGIFVWGYVANRYLADLMPLLFVAGAVGIADLWRRLEAVSRRTQTIWSSAIAVLATVSIVFNVAIASTPQDVGAWQGSRVTSYVQTQEDLSRATGNPIASNIIGGSGLPAVAPADTIYVLDNCAGLFISNGEVYNPWVPVAFAAPLRHDYNLRFVARARRFQRIALVSTGRDVVSTVYLDYSGSRMRLAFSDPLYSSDSDWTPVAVGRSYHIEITADVPRQNLTVNLDGHQVINSLITSGEMRVTGYSGTRPATTNAPFVLSSVPVAKSPLCTSLRTVKPTAFGGPSGS